MIKSYFFGLWQKMINITRNFFILLFRGKVYYAWKIEILWKYPWDISALKSAHLKIRGELVAEEITISDGLKQQLLK